MKYKGIMITGLLFFTLGLAIIFQQTWINRAELKPELVKKNGIKTKDLDTVPEVVRQPRFANLPALSNAKEGWGFRKNKSHQTPEITSHQKELVDKYGIYFVADEKSKEVVLTFDLGYEKGFTESILNTLRKHQVKAIFFVTGPWLKENPELGKRMVREGHVIGNHTWSHPSLPSLGKEEFKADIKKLEDAIVETTGQSRSIKYLRPPMGEYSEQTLQWTREIGYKTVLWSIALKDWLPMGGADKAVGGVLDNLHNGAIILLHGVSQDVTLGLDQILSQVTARGYKVIPIDKVKS